MGWPNIVRRVHRLFSAKLSLDSVIMGCLLQPHIGFDHGIGHPLLLLCHAKASNRRKNKAFKDLGHYSEWPKVADAVI